PMLSPPPDAVRNIEQQVWSVRQLRCAGTPGRKERPMGRVEIFFRRTTFLLALLVSMTLAQLSMAQQNVFAAGAGPCDIYAAGGTPCVAAHSTTRALFSGYGGRLYQVRRASDGATTDIGTLSVGGFANA